MTVSSEDALDEKIRNAAEKKSLPSGDPMMVIGHRLARKLAASANVSLGRLYSRAAAGGVFPERFLRNAKAFSAEDQTRLLSSRVAVVGLGGLGGSVVEILARIGIGALTLIDGDRFEENNLNRQLISTLETLGASKAKEAGRRVEAVNPAVDMTIHEAFCTPDNADRLLAGADLVVDCLDSIPTRFQLESAARAAGTPMVSAAAGSRHRSRDHRVPRRSGACDDLRRAWRISPKGVGGTAGMPATGRDTARRHGGLRGDQGVARQGKAFAKPTAAGRPF